MRGEIAWPTFSGCSRGARLEPISPPGRRRCRRRCRRGRGRERLRSAGARGRAPRRARSPRCDQPLPASEEAAITASGIDRTTLIAAMAQARPAVIACYHDYERPGVANVRVEVAPSGLVERALVCGELAG